MKNKFTVTPTYIRHKIEMLEIAISGICKHLPTLTRQMEIDAHVEQLRIYDAKLIAEKARLAGMEAAKV